MPFESFTTINFKPKTRRVIEQANEIINDYLAQGFKLTLRQLYYQFVSRDLIPNKQSEYKRLGSIIDDARQAGLIDWAAIEDRTRNLESLSVWRDPNHILTAVSEQYREDWWAHQEVYPEVWIEKDALTGVIEGVCEEFRVPYFACRGYASQSEMYDAAKRFQRKRKQGYRPIVFHLGDHDPSGLDMTRDNGARLSLFARGNVEVRRLALNMEQIDLYDPPPNPAKDTDSRFDDYAVLYGTQNDDGDYEASSWELDALDPTVINQTIRDAIEEVIEWDRWETDQHTEEVNRRGLTLTAKNWPEVRTFVHDQFNGTEDDKDE
jgi:hypothetical protein